MSCLDDWQELNILFSVGIYEPKNVLPDCRRTSQNFFMRLKSLRLSVTQSPFTRLTVRAINTSRMILCLSSG